MLAYTGRFDLDFLRRAVQAPDSEEEPESPSSASEQKWQRQIPHHAKAEAKAVFNEGARLATKRDNMKQGGAYQPAGSGQEAVIFSKSQLDSLSKWGQGMLRHELSMAIAKLGHGRLQSKTGKFLDIGGSTGGGARRIIHGLGAAGLAGVPQ